MIIVFVLAVGWFDRSAESTVELGAPSRMLVVNMAGPVRVTTGESASVTHRDSWMLQRPDVSAASRGTETVVRVRCETRMPCRSALEVVAPPSVELVIVSSDIVSIDRFDGELTVLADDSAVALGPVSGSARVVAGGDITGTALRVDSFDASTLGDSVAVSFESEPTIVFVYGANDRVELTLPAASDGVSEAEVTVDSVGEVVIGRSQPGGTALDVDG